MTKENAALAAVETTGFATDRLSGIITAGEAEPSELVAPDNVDPPELRTEVEASERPIAPESPPTNLHATLPQTIDLLGSLWRTEGGSYLEIAAVCLDHMIQICEYSSVKGVNTWQVVNHPESIALAVLRHSEVEADAQAPAWVDALRLRRFEAFGEGIVGTESETPDQIAPTDTRQNLSRDIDDHCGDIASELGIDRVHVMRLTDTALQTIGQVVTLKELTASSPVLKALGEHFMESKARDYLLKLASAMANGPIRKTIHDAAQEAVDEFEHQMTALNERLCEISASVDDKPEKDDDSSEDPEWSKAIQSALATLKEHQDRALGDLDHRLSLLSSKLDTINDDLSVVEQRMDEVQPDWKPTKGKKAPKAKPSQPPIGPKADFLRHSREELMDARSQGKIQTPLDDEDEVVDIDEDEDFDDEDEDEDFDDEDDAVDAVARPAAKPVKKAPQAKAKPAAPASKPPKKGGFDFKVPVGRPRRGPGRPRKPMPPVDSRPMGKTPTSGALKAIDQFMGRKKNPKVRILLSKVASAKLPKFLEKAKKGFFHMEDTGWDIQQQSAFIKWFYSKH
jgi:chaperonin cofactor prefoldin